MRDLVLMFCFCAIAVAAVVIRWSNGRIVRRRIYGRNVRFS